MIEIIFKTLLPILTLAVITRKIKTFCVLSFSYCFILAVYSYFDSSKHRHAPIEFIDPLLVIVTGVPGIFIILCVKKIFHKPTKKENLKEDNKDV